MKKRIGMAAATLLIIQFGLQPGDICHKNNEKWKTETDNNFQTYNTVQGSASVQLVFEWVAKLGRNETRTTAVLTTGRDLFSQGLCKIN